MGGLLASAGGGSGGRGCGGGVVENLAVVHFLFRQVRLVAQPSLFLDL